MPVPDKVTVVGSGIDWSVPASEVGATFTGGAVGVEVPPPPPQADNTEMNNNVMTFIE